MRALFLIFLVIAGFATAGAMIYYMNPSAIDVTGFGILYVSLLVGIAALFLLLGLNFLKASLLSLLILSFLLLQQLRLFNIWIGLALVVVVIIVEQKFSTI